jgi:cellulose synthase/poly-beta-1,6-N-acetylglucosamine synthase-like glycosyltransferase
VTIPKAFPRVWRFEMFGAELERTIPTTAASGGRTSPVISVVVPCYNEAVSVVEFHSRLQAVMKELGESWEVLYVNDGSLDRTLLLLMRYGTETAMSEFSICHETLVRKSPLLPGWITLEETLSW